MCVTFSSLTLHFLPQVCGLVYFCTHTQRQYSVLVFPPCPFIWGHVLSNLSIFVCHNVLVLILRSRLLAQQRSSGLHGCLWGQGRAKGSGFNQPNASSFNSILPMTPNPDHCDPHGSCWSVCDPKTTHNKISRIILLPPSLAPIPQQTHICINYCMRIMLTKLHRHSCGIDEICIQ